MISIVATAAVVALAVLIIASHVRLAVGGARLPAQLIQASLADVTLDLLSERQPLLLTDALAASDHRPLRSTLFRWLHCGLLSTTGTGSSGVGAARFTLISCFDDDECTVSIVPLQKPQLLTDVRMARGRTLVIPPGWRWHSSASVTVSQLHDPVTWIVARARK